MPEHYRYVELKTAERCPRCSGSASPGHVSCLPCRAYFATYYRTQQPGSVVACAGDHDREAGPYRCMHCGWWVLPRHTPIW